MSEKLLPNPHATTPGALIGYRADGRPIYLAAGGSPEDDTTGTTDPAAEPAVDEAPPYVFPFDVPADLAALDEDALRGLLDQVREHAQSFQGLSAADVTPDVIAALRACRDMAVDVSAVIAQVQERGDEAANLAAEIDAAMGAVPAAQPPADPAAVQPPEPAPAAAPAPAAVTAANRRPSVRQVAGRSPAAQVPADAVEAPYAVMSAAADVPHFSAGQRLERFSDAAQALASRLEQYPTLTAGRARMQGGKRPVTVYDPDSPGRVLTMKNYTRHSAVQFRRNFPEQLRVADGAQNGYAIAEYAASERRLPGGNLVQSALAQVKAGRSLTAAVGWCAPSEVIYDLCELETLDGILDAPELQTSRGGWQIPENGGPDFASIFTGIGNAGDTHLTEAEVAAGTEKVCTDIPCPDFDDIRLGVDYLCITGGLLQRRGYPEIVARFARGAMIALAHKINQGFIADIVSQSGAANVVPSDPAGDDAISSLLGAVEIAIEDIRYRARMGFGATVEVVLPHWVLVNMRAAGTRRRGVDMVNISDEQIIQWFARRGAVPRFVYDWQDSFAGQAGAPGGSTPATAMPLAVDFLAYPAGTWVRAVQDVVSLDTIYDSTNLQTNQYTAIFTEDGWAALKMCPISRLYRVAVDPSGVVGCCPGAEVS